MQSSLFDMAPEPEAPTLLPADDFIDIFDDLPDLDVEPLVYPMLQEHVDGMLMPDDPGSDLWEWCRKYNHHLILGEVVLRAKTIEANCLNNDGAEAELKYLVEAYNGDERLLRAQIMEVARVLKLHALQPGMGKNTDETSL